MEWYKEINYKKFLKDELKMIEEHFGIDILMGLYELFSKTAVYFSEKPLMEMKQEYIRKKFGTIPDKQLARMLKVSERLIYKVASQKVIMNDQEDLFDDKK